MNTKPVKQFTDVVNGVIHINLPKDFDAKRVELTIVPLNDDATQLSKVTLGVMEGAFAIPDNFDDALPKAIEDEFPPRPYDFITGHPIFCYGFWLMPNNRRMRLSMRFNKPIQCILAP